MGDARSEPGGPPDPRRLYIPAHRSARIARRVRRRTAADRRVMHRPWNAQRTATCPNLVVMTLLGAAAGVSYDLLDCGLGRVGRPKLYAWLLRAFLKVSEIAAKNPTMGLGGGSGMTLFLMRYTVTALASRLSILAGVARAALGLSGLGCAWRCGCGRRQPRARKVVWPRINVAWRTRGSVVGSPCVCSCGAYPALPHRALGPAPRAASRANWPRRRWTRLRLVASGPIWPLPYRESVSAAPESSVEEARDKPCARLRRP